MREEAIAIVGMGAMLPGGPTVADSWQMIRAGRSEIREVPLSRWDHRIYYDPDPRAPYRTNSKIGSFLEEDIGFRPKEFGLPPILRDQLDPTQQLALLVARQAMQDCGVTDRQPRNWAVCVGNLLGGLWKHGEQWIRSQHIKTEYQLQQSAVFQRMSPGDRAELLDAIQLQLSWSKKPQMTPDSLPGLLGNLIASRISHYFNLTGPNFTIDAACATSLAAIEQAVIGLRARRFDAALAGGADRIMHSSSYIGFAKMGVLSPDGSRPFDAGANGFVMGEGAVLFVLKRYDDAVAAGDKIYALIQGIASSSDGQGRAIAAPNPAGQTECVERAYKDAQIDPATVDLIECHGTSTPIGDPTEIAGLRAVWNKTDRKKPVAIGSIKSNLGHLKGAAGGAAMLKAIMALHTRTLPPQINFQTPNPHCEFAATPFRVQTEVAPWESSQLRRCGVSAFGFGGINYHVVLEEAPMSSDHKPSSFRSTASSASLTTTPAQGTLPLDLPVLALGAATKAELAAGATALAAALRSGETAATYAKRAALVSDGLWRASLFHDESAEAATLLEQLGTALAEDKSLKKLEAKGVFVRDGAPLEGKVACMFPGQGSQYVQMTGELQKHFPIVKETIEEADEVMASLLPKKLSAYMVPPADVDEGTAFVDLLQTEVLQPAVLAADTAMWRLLKPLLNTDLVMGHSLGEYGAAIAAGVFSFADALRIVAARGEAIAAVADHMDDNGAMMGVGTDADTVDAILKEEDDGYVIVANKNCPTQTIIAGATEAVMAASRRLEAKGFETIQLPVSHAFHSAIVSPASPYLLEGLKKIDIKAPKMTLLSNVTAGPYPTDESAPDWIRETLSVHLARPVEWQKMVELAYEKGYRYFIEVGPKRALSSFVKSILKDKPHCAAFSSHPKFGERNSLGRLLAQLVAEGLIAYGSPVQQAPVMPSFHAPPTEPSTTFPPLTTPTTTVVTQAFQPPADTPVAPQHPTPQAQWNPPPQAMQPPMQQQAQPMMPMQQMAPMQQPMHYMQPMMPMMPPSPYAVFSDPGFWHFMMANGGSYFQHMVEQYRHQSMHSYQVATAMSYGMHHAPQVHHHAPPMQQPALPYSGYPQQAAPAYAPENTHPHAAIPYSHPHFSQPPQAAPPTLPPLPHMTAPTAPPAPTMVNMPAYTPPLPSPATAAYVATAPSAEGDTTQTILQIVADRTGYDTDELGLDEHLEADLGIDSIRQVEVMAEVRDLYKLPTDDNFNINDFNTLRGLIGYVERMRSGGDRPGAQASGSDDSGVSG